MPLGAARCLFEGLGPGGGCWPGLFCRRFPVSVRCMVTAMHEVLADLFRSQPSLAVELLSGPFRLAVPEHEIVELSAADLTKVVPSEFRADAVVLLRSRGKAVLGVVVEVQLSRKTRKRWTWPW